MNQLQINKKISDEEILFITRNSCTGRSPVRSIGVLERADMAVTKLQISPVIVNGFENGFHRWIQRIFLVVVETKEIVYRKIF